MEIKGFNNYYIENGEVYHKRHNRKIIGHIDAKGYKKIVIRDNDKKPHCLRLHRLIWESNYGEIPDGYEIHHKDFNSLNNSLDNLQLLSKEEHLKLHGDINSEKYKGKNHPRARSCAKLDKDTLEILEVKPYASAFTKDGFDCGCITRCCKGKQKYHGGFTFRYVDELGNIIDDFAA